MKMFYTLALLLLPAALLYSQAGSFYLLHCDLRVSGGRLVVDSSSLEGEDSVFPAGARRELQALVTRSLGRIADLSALEFEDSLCFDNGNCRLRDESLNNLVEGYLAFCAADTSGPGAMQSFFQSGLPFSPQQWLETELFPLLNDFALEGSPLQADPDGLQPERLFFGVFQLQFLVRPPIRLEQINIVWDRRDTLPRQQVLRMLQGLDRKLWYRRPLEKALEEHYFLLNYQLEYRIGDTLIEVLPCRINRALVMTDSSANPDEVFYWLLNSRQFRQYRRLPRESLKLELDSPGKAGYLLRFDQFVSSADAQALPLFDTRYFQQGQLQLQKQRYSLSATAATQASGSLAALAPEDLSLFLELNARKLAEDSPPDSTGSNVPPALAQPDPAQTGALVPFGNNRLNPPEAPRTDGLKRNYLGIGLEFNINDATVIKGIYQRLLADGATLSLQFGYAFNELGAGKGQLFFSGNFFQDFLFFRSLGRRLSLQLTAQSLFTANRVLDGLPVRERRSGGQGRMELEWFRDLNGHMLRSGLSLASHRIDLGGQPPGLPEQLTLTYVDFSLLHFFQRFSGRLTQLRLEPTLRLGWNRHPETQASENYFRLGFQGTMHRDLPGGLAIRLSGFMEYCSEFTPWFEQSALQVARNRGFREDEVIAASAFGAQPEWWLPLPGIGAKGSRFNRYLDKHLRLATFADLGYFSRPAPGSQAGWRWSPGLGLRLIMPPAQINFDWAYGLAEGPLPDGRGRFSINLLINSPL